MKINIALIILLLLACLSTGIMTKMLISEKSNTHRLQSDITTLTKEKRSKDSSSYQVKILNFKLAEIKNSFPDLVTELKNELDIKIKNAIQIQKTIMTVNQTYKTTVKDSFKIDSVKVECFNYQDSFKLFSAERINGDLYVTHDITKVPLLQVVHREPWRLKNILPWNKREIVQDIKSENPHASITFNRVINIVK